MTEKRLCLHPATRTATDCQEIPNVYRNRPRRKIGFYIAAVTFVIFVLLSAYPVFFMFTGSLMVLQKFKAAMDFYLTFHIPANANLHIFPGQITLSQYYQAILRTPAYLLQFWNSIYLLIPILAGNLTISAMAGYAFAKLRFPLKRQLLFLYMLVLILPFQVTLVPNFMVLQRLGLIGSRWAVILPSIFSPFGPFLLHQFSKKLPNSVFEMARVEGAGERTVFLKIALPQMKPGLASLAILTVIDVWSMTEQPLTLLQTTASMPLSVTLSSLTRTSPEVGFVCGTVFLLPILLSFLMGEEYLVDGMVDMML